MSEKTRAVLPLLLAGLIFPAAGSMPESVAGSLSGEMQSPEAREAEALYRLGVMRMNGEGGTQDIAAGRYWIHLAARHGYPLAQYNLGVMYFDGIGGEYNRLCAQWWLTRAAGQDDPDVHQMAEQALQSVLPEMSTLPKVYRPVSAVECDRLPVWPQEARLVAYTQVLPQGDIDTEKMIIIQEESVVAETDAVTENSPKSEMNTETVTETFMVQEQVMAPEADISNDTMKEVMAVQSVDNTVNQISGAVVLPEKSETELPVVPGGAVGKGDAVIYESGNGEAGETDIDKAAVGTAEDKSTESENVYTIPLLGDTDNTGPRENKARDEGKEGPPVSVAVAPTSDKTEQGGNTGRGQEKRSAESDEKVKVLKHEFVSAAPVLNIGGNPATASGNHYTLQLSGGTSPDQLYRTARRHMLTNYVVYETERHGRRWYVLVAGEYETLKAANQALKALPAELRRNGPWVRSVRQVQKELK